MAEVNPPYVLQTSGTQHTALIFRRTILGLVGTEGVSRLNTANDLKVTQNSPTGMSVLADRGGGFIQGDDIQDQGLYFVYNDASTAVTITAAHATLARKDIIVARVKDATHGQPGDTWSLEAIAGTPASSPTEPSLPATALKLAVVDVAANASAITNANITDTRVATAGILPLRKNSGGTEFARRRLNLIEGSNITLTVADDGADDEIDVTIAGALAEPYIGCRAIRSAAASFSIGSSLTVGWDSETNGWDTSNIHSTSTNNNRFTVPTGKSGKWRAEAVIGVTGAQATSVVASVRKNTGTVNSTFSWPPSTAYGIINATLDLVAGDYIDVLLTASGTAGATVSFIGGVSYMHVYFLGA